MLISILNGNIPINKSDALSKETFQPSTSRGWHNTIHLLVIIKLIPLLNGFYQTYWNNRWPYRCECS